MTVPGPSGRTVITARALERVAIGVAREEAGVPAKDVVVALTDAAGDLRIGVTVPVSIDGAGRRQRTLDERAVALRRRLVDGMGDLAGRTVGAVDVRYAGVRRSTERRVG